MALPWQQVIPLTQIFLPESWSTLNFSKLSGHIWWVLINMVKINTGTAPLPPTPRSPGETRLRESNLVVIRGIGEEI